MYVSELWRFPVKSMRGERLNTALMTEDGVAGDRLVHVRQRGNVLTARTRHALLTLSATTAADGTALVDGHPWTSPKAAAAVEARGGPGAELVRYKGRERFDVLPLLVATDGAISAFGHDGRRLRPNLVVGGVESLNERAWPGRALRIGEVLIGVESLRARCVITTIDPDTGARDLDVLRRIHRVFESTMALNCWVACGGTVRIGDAVELVDEQPPRPQRGGWIVGAPYLVG